MKTILLIDTLWEGHHPTYMKVIAKTLLELGHAVISACPDPQEMHLWINSHDLLGGNQFEAIVLHEPKMGKLLNHRLQSIAMTLARWRQAAQCIQDRKTQAGRAPDLVFFPCLDSYLGLTPAIVDRIFPHQWSGLFFQPRYALLPKKLPWLRRGILNPISALNSTGCRIIAIQDETIATDLEHRLGKPVVIFPDFTDESCPDMSFDLIKKILSKAAGRKIIGLLGSLERRKGMLTLLEVTQQIGNDWFFVFAGKLAEPTFTRAELDRIQEVVQANPDNCLFYFAQISTEAQFNAVVETCDVLYAVYENFQTSSNLLTKAAVFKKTMLTSDHYCIGERVQKYQLGYTVKESDVMGCVLILQRMHEEFRRGCLSIKPDFDGYRQQHSNRQLRAALETSLQFISAELK